MSLFSAMMASVSGMQGQANLLSTISDNISNSGDDRLQGSDCDAFEDMLSQVSTTSYTAGGVGTTIGYNIASQGEFTSAASADQYRDQRQRLLCRSGSRAATPISRERAISARTSMASSSIQRDIRSWAIPSRQLTASSPPGSVSQLTPITITTAGLVANPSTSGTLTANLNSSSAIDAGTLPAANTAASTYTDMTSVTAYDNLGTPVTLNVYFTKTATNTWEMDVFNAANAAPGGGFPYTSGPLVTQTLTFSAATGDLTDRFAGFDSPFRTVKRSISTCRI